mmetsp:Transcript_21510/g.52706  ORF Transcript_21510/g.52706 Transcript_21510/m.52706 type:complete len:88 (+) Transcript_21510:7-270(+)
METESPNQNELLALSMPQISIRRRPCPSNPLLGASSTTKARIRRSGKSRHQQAARTNSTMPVRSVACAISQGLQQQQQQQQQQQWVS